MEDQHDFSSQTMKETLGTGPSSIKRGIFQGDALSSLLFTVLLNPLSGELPKTRYGH